MERRIFVDDRLNGLMDMVLGVLALNSGSNGSSRPCFVRHERVNWAASCSSSGEWPDRYHGGIPLRATSLSDWAMV
jgi:hypothetical protein